jgi:predicted DNA-binding protein YlxM (UPF0122 family)
MYIFWVILYRKLHFARNCRRVSVSRAAVSDSLDKIAKSLLSYEAYLKMNYHSDSIRIAIAKYKNGEIDVAALIAAIEEELI